MKERKGAMNGNLFIWQLFHFGESVIPKTNCKENFLRFFGVLHVFES